MYLPRLGVKIHQVAATSKQGGLRGELSERFEVETKFQAERMSNLVTKFLLFCILEGFSSFVL